MEDSPEGLLIVFSNFFLTNFLTFCCDSSILQLLPEPSTETPPPPHGVPTPICGSFMIFIHEVQSSLSKGLIRSTKTPVVADFNAMNQNQQYFVHCFISLFAYTFNSRECISSQTYQCAGKIAVKLGWSHHKRPTIKVSQEKHPTSLQSLGAFLFNTNINIFSRGLN